MDFCTLNLYEYLLAEMLEYNVHHDKYVYTILIDGVRISVTQRKYLNSWKQASKMIYLDEIFPRGIHVLALLWALE
jgi:hypothetical protein